jgi:CheY-like chemotaxis protein
MNTPVVAAALLLLASMGTNDPLLACGEKFLMGSRGTRFERPATVRQPAAILVYANPALNLPRALANVPFEATLRKAGYRPTVVTSAEALSSALDQGGWDLVLADVSDSQAVSSRTQNAKSPIVLSVMYNPTGAELAAAKKQHQRILKAPTKNQSFLDAIDAALALKSQSQARSGN